MPPFAFIASPSADCKVFRDEVRASVGKSGFTPISMEDFWPTQQNAVAACRAAVEAASLFIGIFGYDLGDTPDKSDPEGATYIEIEWQHAKALGKDIIWFLWRHDESEALASARVMAMRARIKRHLSSSFSSVEQLPRHAHKALFELSRRKHLIRELALRYGSRSGSRRFVLVPASLAGGGDIDAVMSAAAREFVVSILHALNDPRLGHHAQVHVGIAGGIAQEKIVRKLECDSADLLPIIPEIARNRITFVAMNSAAFPDRFTATANYLAARLSELIGGSKHFVCLRVMSAHRREEYLSMTAHLSVLLAGFAERDAFLDEWLGEFSAGSQLPDDMIGDYCYVPIDTSANAMPMNAMPAAVRHALGDLNVGMSFSALAEYQVPAIFPLSGLPRLDRGGELTAKWHVGHVVLSHLKNYLCVLDEQSAANLLSHTLCGLEMVSEKWLDREGGICCETRESNGGRRGVVRIVHQSPRRRFDSPDRAPQRDAFEILISEPLGPMNTAEAQLIVRHDLSETFCLTPKIRRPGLWTTTTIRIALDEMRGLPRPAGGLRILDMGCGSGAVGLMIERALRPSVTDLHFVDISDAALACAHDNARRMALPESLCRYDKSDLFAALDPAVTYDLVVFNPPFMPRIDLPFEWVGQGNDGGIMGTDIALAFARDCARFLRQGGKALVCLPGYLAVEPVGRAFQPRNQVKIRKLTRKVLYPYRPPPDWRESFEVLRRDELEQKFGPLNLRDEFWLDDDGRTPGHGAEPPRPSHFVSFDMVHWVAEKL